MIPNPTDRQIETRGISESQSFGISYADAAHIMTILRDSVYTDKVMAVLREYGANAWDAHRSVGKANVPIKITIPTAMDPTLIIRDYGPGISPQDMRDVFTQYGASTKRGSDLMVGMLGIGAKSGFAYSDTFTVTSWYGGTMRMYVALLDATEMGTLNLLHEAACGEETGIQIQIPVRPSDIREFTRKASNLYSNFIPQPEINIQLESKNSRVPMKNGVFYADSEEWVALMGCVPYSIDIDQLRGSDGRSRVGEFVKRTGGALFFDIGEVQVSASREELKYSDSTKDAVVKKFELLSDEYVAHTLSGIKDSSLSFWDMRIRAQLFNKLGLPVPKEIEDLVKEYVTFPDDTAFFIHRHGTACHKVAISVSTRFLLQDVNNELAGYDFGSFDYLVKPTKGSSLSDALTKLKEIIKEKQLEGLPIENLSSLNWTAPVKKGKKGGALGKKTNKKHQVSTFRYVFGPSKPPWSDRWEIEVREPTDSDVWVVINSFKVSDYHFMQMYQEDKLVADALGMDMPAVYGYKSTPKKPVDRTKILGTPYNEWSKTFIASILTDDVKKNLNTLRWSEDGRYWRLAKSCKKHLDKLGPQHLLNRIVERWDGAGKLVKKMSQKEVNALKCLKGRLGDSFKYETDVLLEEMGTKYPLLEATNQGMYAFSSSLSDHWFDYIELVDFFYSSKSGVSP